MTSLFSMVGRADEHAGDRIKDGKNIRFIEPTTCSPEVRTFLAEARYWFGRGTLVTDKAVRIRLDVQLLDYRNVNGVILSVCQVNKDRQESWQKFSNRKLVYHLAAVDEKSPTEISDAPIHSLSGQRLHWYIKHGLSPLAWLVKHDAELAKEVLDNFPALLAHVSDESVAGEEEV